MKLVKRGVYFECKNFRRMYGNGFRLIWIALCFELIKIKFAANSVEVRRWCAHGWSAYGTVLHRTFAARSPATQHDVILITSQLISLTLYHSTPSLGRPGGPGWPGGPVQNKTHVCFKRKRLKKNFVKVARHTFEKFYIFTWNYGWLFFWRTKNIMLIRSST